MSQDDYLLELLHCRGANKPHHDVTFDRTICQNCGSKMMISDNCDNDKPSFQDIFRCLECKYQATRYILFRNSLDKNDNYDIVRAIIFTEDTELNPSAEIYTRINNAIDALMNRGLSEDRAEDIVYSQASCYTCGLDYNTEDLTLTFDYTNIKPFYVCKSNVWMIGGF